MLENRAGGCVCGAIRYACRSEPIEAYFCHCTHCQKITGGAYGAMFMMRKDQVELSGEPATYAVPTAYGDLIELFCATCGTRIGAESASEPGSVSLSAGTLDDPSAFAPSVHYWVRSKQPWDLICDDLKREATQ